MTIEKAKNILFDMLGDTTVIEPTEQNQAILIAIKALEQQSVLDKIRAEILCNIVEDDTSGNIPARLRADWDAANKAHMIDTAIIDKYRAES